jgi:hypothetical protein
MNPSKEHRKVEEQNRKIQKQEATITQVKRGGETASRSRRHKYKR